MHVTTFQYEIRGKKSDFLILKLNPPEQKKLIGKSSTLARGKSCVLPTDPFFTLEIDYIPMYPSDR